MVVYERVTRRVTSGGVSLPYVEVCFRLRQQGHFGPDLAAREAGARAQAKRDPCCHLTHEICRHSGLRLRCEQRIYGGQSALVSG